MTVYAENIEPTANKMGTAYKGLVSYDGAVAVSDLLPESVVLYPSRRPVLVIESKTFIPMVQEKHNGNGITVEYQKAKRDEHSYNVVTVKAAHPRAMQEFLENPDMQALLPVDALQALLAQKQKTNARPARSGV